MIEIIDGTWLAGETKTFHINGEYLELLDAQYQCDVYLMDKSGAQLSVMKKCEASFFSKPTGGFNTVQIYSAQAQYIRFFVGSGDAGTRRISSTVQVVDGERARTNAGVMFFGNSYAAALAANYSKAQLWNPAGSGKRMILQQVSMFSSAVQAANIAVSMAAETTDQTAAHVANKLAGSAIGAGQSRIGYAGAPPAQSFYGVPLSANTCYNWRIAGVIVLSPGSGLTVVGAVPNAEIGANWEWFEEAI